MATLDGILMRYCEIFGFSSCYGLSWTESSCLIAVGVFVLVVIGSVVRRVVTGIRD
jgi:hypothetical protein